MFFYQTHTSSIPNITIVNAKIRSFNRLLLRNVGSFLRVSTVTPENYLIFFILISYAFFVVAKLASLPPLIILFAVSLKDELKSDAGNPFISQQS